MALFTDGLINSSGELQKYESDILNVASTEGIDMTAKASLAQEQIASDLILFLRRNRFNSDWYVGRRAPHLHDIVITNTLKRWHCYETLGMTYQDAYNNQLNDRYQGKWTQYVQLAAAAEQTLFEIGVGVVDNPVPKGSPPEISLAPMSVSGTNFYVRGSWINSIGQEGLASDVVQATADTGSAIIVRMPHAPAGVVSWNLYAGMAPNAVTLQNSTPLAPNQSWIAPATGLSSSGRNPGSGQTPDRWVIDRRILQRG